MYLSVALNFQKLLFFYFDDLFFFSSFKLYYLLVMKLVDSKVVLPFLVFFWLVVICCTDAEQQKPGNFLSDIASYEDICHKLGWEPKCNNAQSSNGNSYLILQNLKVKIYLKNWYMYCNLIKGIKGS